MLLENNFLDSVDIVKVSYNPLLLILLTARTHKECFPNIFFKLTLSK